MKFIMKIRNYLATLPKFIQPLISQVWGPKSNKKKSGFLAKKWEIRVAQRMKDNLLYIQCNKIKLVGMSLDDYEHAY